MPTADATYRVGVISIEWLDGGWRGQRWRRPYEERPQEVQHLTRALREALEQQTATAEILRVISSSPTNVQPVFDTIVESVVRLCDGVSGTVYRFDGDLIHLIAQHHSLTSEQLEAFRQVYPIPPSRTSVVAQSILDRTVIHARDFESDPGIPSASREMARAVGHRSLLVVPMLREEGWIVQDPACREGQQPRDVFYVHARAGEAAISVAISIHSNRTISATRSTRPAGRWKSWGAGRCSCDRTRSRGATGTIPTSSRSGRELERLQVPLGFHEGFGPYLPQVGDRFGADLQMVHTACHPMEMMLAVISMIGGGVLERHPNLRVVFLEGNCGWVPFLLWRLDEHYEVTFRREPTLTMKPSEYFRRQGFVSVEADEDFVKQVIDSMSDDTIVFSTDWPHGDSKYPHAVEAFMKLPISEDSKRKILWDNCALLRDRDRLIGGWAGYGGDLARRSRTIAAQLAASRVPVRGSVASGPTPPPGGRH